MEFLPNGIGGSTGDDLVICRPLTISGTVWYVNSVGGVDAASPAGKDRQKPLATLAQAQTNATDFDIVVLMDGHTETYVAALSITKKLCIAAEGSASGLPTVKFYINSAAGDVFTISTDHVELRNILFPASVQANVGGNGGKIYVNAADFFLTGCYFQCGANDNMSAVISDTTVTRMRVDNCTFISTATVVATRPKAGIRISVAGSDVRINGTIFSDGTVGFQEEALHTSAFVQTRLVMEGCSFLLGADATINASTTYRINPQTSTGGGRIVVA